MRTEQEWAKFAQHVKVGDRVKWVYGEDSYEGVLLENYPHAERARESADLSACIDLLVIKYDDGEEASILANYEYFQVRGDETWYRFDDILSFDDEPLPFEFPVDDPNSPPIEKPGVNLGVIEDMESTLIPDDHTVKARGVWLMDAATVSIFYEGSALGSVQHELSCLKDTIRKLSNVGELFDGRDECNEFTFEENNKVMESALDRIWKIVTRKGRYTPDAE